MSETTCVFVLSVPGEPRRVRLEAVNSTAVRVQWRAPLEREQNGVIRGYQVLYLRIDDREQGVGRTRVYDVMDGLCILVSFLDALTMLVWLMLIREKLEAFRDLKTTENSAATW